MPQRGGLASDGLEVRRHALGALLNRGCVRRQAASSEHAVNDMPVVMLRHSSTLDRLCGLMATVQRDGSAMCRHLWVLSFGRPPMLIRPRRRSARRPGLLPRVRRAAGRREPDAQRATGRPVCHEVRFRAGGTALGEESVGKSQHASHHEQHETSAVGYVQGGGCRDALPDRGPTRVSWLNRTSVCRHTAHTWALMVRIHSCSGVCVVRCFFLGLGGTHEA